MQAMIRDTWELVRDGWQNILTGMGTSRDKASATTYGIQPLVPRLELAAIYESEGLLSRIVDVVAEDMVRAGWTLKGDQDGKLAKEGKDLEVATHVAQALKWTRLFGGAIIVLDLDDGLPWDQPYNWEKGTAKVRRLKVFSSARIVIGSSDFSSDTASDWFEEIERFEVKRRFGGVNFRVHSSRCVVFKGVPVPDCSEISGYDLDVRYWGLSVIQRVFQTGRALGTFVQGIAHLGTEVTIGKYTISNLEQLVAENDWKAVRNRIRIIDESKSIIRAVLLGENEKYERDSLTFTGIPEVFDRLVQLVSAYSDGIPVSRLFGKRAGGLGDKGEGDSRDYYDMIANKQVSYLEKPLLRLYRAINGGIKAVSPDELGLEFRPVWTPSQTEQATIRKTVAETDKMYKDMGVLHEEQIFDTRFKNGYQVDYTIEGEWEKPEPDPEMALALQQSAQGSLLGQPTPKAPGKAPAPQAPGKPAPGKSADPSKNGTEEKK